MNIAALRTEYTRAELDENSVARAPHVQFARWLEEAIEAHVPEPTAMSIATVDASGRPSSRMVLLKDVDAHGFTFYTNRESRKGTELAANPHASLLFFWPELQRQVRVEGAVQQIADAEADAYYHSRPLGSRIGAWASPQSQVLPDRAWLEARVQALSERYGANPPRPPHWGGLRLVPDRLEFWQGRASRLHDRIRYRRAQDGWTIERLAP